MMRLNMDIEAHVKKAAVDGAHEDGMLLSKWVSKAILERRTRQLQHEPTQDQIRKSLQQQAQEELNAESNVKGR